MLKKSALTGVAFLLSATPALAQGVLLPAGDVRLREDLTLLVDERVVNLPVNAWPLSRADVAAALDSVDASKLQDLALRNALSRVVAASRHPENADDWRIREIRVAAGQAGLLRDQGTPGREDFELTATGGVVHDRYAITLAATVALDPQDGQELRLDGSSVSILWGNWYLGANQIDRWWGPGHDGSLILSNNARPMPALSLDRVRSLPVDLPILRWLGPWRFNAFLGLGEDDRPDVDRPAFMAMRFSFKPAPNVEVGLSRSAQFCGKGRRCSLETFGRMLIGQDNIGIRGLEDPQDEPGNQMAGFDARLASPWSALPVALYGQAIGEDNSSTGIPERYLAIFGGETWLPFESGAVLRAHVEYANTKVKWYDSEIEYDSAYRQAIFFAGYRYRGRNIGHTTDADSETTSTGFSLTTGEGHRWAVLERHGRLDRGGTVDTHNLLTAGPSDYRSWQLSWDARLRRHDVGILVGREKQTPASAGNARGAFGFIQWRMQLP